MTPEQKRELADAIVSCGVGEKREFPGRYHVNGATLWQERFIRDWRVAGAMMGLVDAVYVEKLVDGSWQAQASMDAMPTEWIENESLAIAINQACVAALRGKDERDQV